MTTETLTLAGFLLARIAEDEAAARAAAAVSETARHWHAERDWTTTTSQYTLADADTRTLFVCCEEGLTRHDDPARTLHDDGRGIGVATKAEVDHIARWDPARILAECEAKRRIVALHPSCVHYHGGTYCELCDAYEVEEGAWSGRGDLYPCDTLRALASVYADHDGYPDEWKP